MTVLPLKSGKDYPLAYVILAHGEWSTLTDLVDVLAADPDDTVIIHVDQKTDWRRLKATQEHLKKYPNVTLFSELRCKWGGVSLVDATLLCLKRLEATGRPYKYVSLLSGIDYPIKPLSQLRQRLATSNGREFVEARNFYTERWIKTGIYVERFEYWFPFARSGLLTRPFLLWYKLVEKLDRRRILSPGFVPYSGSQWWTLSQGFIKWMLAEPRAVELRDRMKSTFVPDEMYFHTLIMSSPFASNVAFHNLRHIEWLASGTPHTFKSADFDRLKTSKEFFCRKIVKRYHPDLVARIKNDLLTPPSARAVAIAKTKARAEARLRQQEAALKIAKKRLLAAQKALGLNPHVPLDKPEIASDVVLHDRGPGRRAALVRQDGERLLQGDAAKPALVERTETAA